MKKQLLFLSILFIFIGINLQSANEVVSSRHISNTNVDGNNSKKTDSTIETLWDGYISQSGNDEYFPDTQISKNLRVLNIDAYLGSLTIPDKVLNPSFNREIFNYTVTVGLDVETITINATPYDNAASISENSSIGEQNLQIGNNEFTITVIAEDMTTIKTYTLNIEQDIIISPLPPTNGHSVSDTTLTFIPDGVGESVINTLNIDRFEENATISSLDDIERIFLNIEHSYLGDLSMYITCPNNQRCVLKAYSATNPSGVTNVATPGSTGGGNIHLGFAPDPSITSPCYLTPGVGMYYWFTPTGTTAFGTGGPTVPITYTDPCGNTETQQQLNSGEYGPYEYFNSLIGCPVNGEWTLTITDHLSLDNGYLFEWGITFAEYFQPIISTDASLFNIIVSEGELIPGFSPDIFEYTVNVEPDIETIEISATTSSRYATITEDSSIGEQNLNHGNNEFNITVIAEDGINSLTYSIVVNKRIPNNDATLSSLIVSQGELTPEFDPQTLEYTVYVEPDIRVIEIIAITTDNLATIIDNNSTGEQGLDYGINIFPVGVLAEDLITTQTYSIIVNRGYVNITDNEITSFTIYPNPAKDYINLNLSGLKENATIKIINTSGIICYEQKLQGGIAHEISTEHLANGIYFLLINDKVIKLIIE